MPQALPRTCRVHGCPNDATCQVHKRSNTTRIRGRRLQELRTRLFYQDPFCVECRKEGYFTRWTQRDHIIPLAYGGKDDETNQQGLCDAHHAAKSAREAARRWA